MVRILLIDDDISLIDVLTMAFADAGYEVTSARDGVRGLALATSEKPDAIVSDINMPGLDGFALCRKLRREGDAVDAGADRASSPTSARVSPTAS